REEALGGVDVLEGDGLVAAAKHQAGPEELRGRLVQHDNSCIERRGHTATVASKRFRDAASLLRVGKLLGNHVSITTGTIMGRRRGGSETNRPAAFRTTRCNASMSTGSPELNASCTAARTSSAHSSRRSSASGAYTHPRVITSGPVTIAPLCASTVTTTTTTPSSASTRRSRNTPCPTSPTMPST